MENETIKPVFKDIFGRPLSIGNEVAFNPPTYKGLLKGVVIAFTPKMVRVEYKWTSKKRPESTVVFPQDLCRKDSI